MRPLALAVLALSLLPTFARAVDQPVFPDQKKRNQMLADNLNRYVRSDGGAGTAGQKTTVLRVINEVMAERVGPTTDPKYAENWGKFRQSIRTPEGKKALIDDVERVLKQTGGAEARAAGAQLSQMSSQDKQALLAGAAAVTGQDIGTQDGQAVSLPGNPVGVFSQALSVFLGLQGTIADDLRHQQEDINRREEERRKKEEANRPGGEPGNGKTNPINPTPPVTDPRVRGVTTATEIGADQHPGDNTWTGRATYGNWMTGNYGASTNWLRNYNGQDPSVLVAGGRSAFQTGDADLAGDAGRRAAEADPNNSFAQALANLSHGHLDGVNVDGALQKAGAGSLNAGAINAEGDAKMAASAMPEGGGAAVAATNFFGSGNAAASNPQTAAEIAAAAQRAMTTPPTKVEQSSALTKEAASSLRVQDYQKAYTIASQAIDLNPRNAQAWNYRAIADNKLSQYKNAVYDASFSLGLVPGNAPALQTRSWAFAKQAQYREALADANFTIEKEPSNAFAFQNRAFAQAGMGDKQGALESLRKSAELDPRFKDKYEAAMQAPENSDLLFLFNDEPARGAPAGAPARGNRFLRLMLLSLFGGLIIALGVLNVVSERWREGMRQTIRRVIGSPAPVAEGGTGQFWGGQYEMVRQIGSGGMGVVYEATDRSLDRKVAVKKMRDEVRMDPAERQRFVQEARTVASLHHPNIVDIFAIVEDDQDVYLVFEYVAGKTLSEDIRDRGSYDLTQARRILSGACAAVEHAHKNNIIHRDIKPSNIMLSGDGTVKVMDFGVARQAKDAMTRQALTNTIVGTPPYMAPEQEQGSVRKESDVFSLASVFYEMLTGRLPFQGQGAGMLLNKINGKHVPATSLVPSLPPGLDSVIAKALAADPEKRFQTPAEFLAAVDAFVGSPAS